MSNSPEARRARGADEVVPRPRHPLVWAVAVVLLLEAAAAVVATVYLVVEIFLAPSTSVASASALAAVCAIAAAWIAVIAVNVLRGNAWTRGAAIVVQVLIGAIAIGSFQGMGASPAVGGALLVPAVFVILALFAKPVVAATSRRAR